MHSKRSPMPSRWAVNLARQWASKSMQQCRIDALPGLTLAAAFDELALVV